MLILIFATAVATSPFPEATDPTISIEKPSVTQTIMSRVETPPNYESPKFDLRPKFRGFLHVLPIYEANEPKTERPQPYFLEPDFSNVPRTQNRIPFSWRRVQTPDAQIKLAPVDRERKK